MRKKRVEHLFYSLHNTVICALALPNICLSVGGKYADIAIARNPCLQSLKLADRDDSPNKEINLLIGTDFY